MNFKNQYPSEIDPSIEIPPKTILDGDTEDINKDRGFEESNYGDEIEFKKPWWGEDEYIPFNLIHEFPIRGLYTKCKNPKNAAITYDDGISL